MKKLLTLAKITYASYFAIASPLVGDVVLHYSFDTNYQDSSVSENHGVLFDSDGNGSVSLVDTAAVFGDGGVAQGDQADRVDLTTPFTPADGTPWTIAFWADLNGGAASYGFNSNDQHAIQARADSESSVNVWVAGQKFTFDSAGVIGQNSKDNHYVVIANPEGIDLDGVAGDDKIAVYANGQLLVPDPGQDITDVSISTAIEVTMLGDSGQWPYGSAGDYDELWILDEALNANAVKALYTQNYPHELWYVDADTVAAEVDQQGYSWDTAFDHLQDALAVAGENAMIWVANGVYRPVVPLDPANPTFAEQSVSFSLKSGQKLYGGFAGNEASIDIPFNPGNVKLSGDIGNDDINGSNGYADLDIGFQGRNSLHVVSVEGAEDCVINGFIIIEGGDASASDAYDRTGGGLFVKDSGSIAIENCEFEHNHSRSGSALYVKNTEVVMSGCEFTGNRASNGGGAVMVNHAQGDGKPSFEAVECLFRDNQADIRGGALNTTYAELRFYNSKFIENTAPTGGAIDVYRSSGHFVNCLLVDNTASSNGGAVAHRSGGALSYVNATLYGNSTSGEGHHVYLESSAAQAFVNSVLWHGDTVPASGSAVYKPSGGETYEHCLVQAVDLSGVGIGNLDGTLAVNHPEFSDPSGGEYGVRAYSPLVNAGVTNPVKSGMFDTPDHDEDGDLDEIYPADLYDNDDPRVVGQSIDIGAFEHQDPFEPEVLEYGYEDFGSGGPWRRISLSDALDSEDDAATVSVTDTSVVDTDLEEGEILLTVKDYGSTEVVIDFQYKGGVVHEFRLPVLVSPEGLESRDLSTVVDVNFTSADLGVAHVYADLSAIFTDSPIEIVASSKDGDVFTVSMIDGVVSVVPIGFGQSDLEIVARYSDGTELALSRVVSVELLPSSQAIVDAIEPAWGTINGASPDFAFADLSTTLTEGVTAIVASSSDESVFTVSVTDGVVSVHSVATGTATVVVELQFSNGTKYVFDETVSVLDAEGHLHANYAFDGDAVNSVTGLDALLSAEGVLQSATDITIGELGMVSAPDAVTSGLLRVDGSLQLNLRFKIESAEEDGVKMLAAIKDNNTHVITGRSGLMFSYSEDSSNSGFARIYFSYSDGLTNYYEFETVAECAIGQWHDLQLVFDFDREVWTVLIGQEFSTGAVNNHEAYAYDYNALKDVLRNNSLTVGKFAAMNVQDVLEESELTIDSLQLYSPAQSVNARVGDAFDSLRMHITDTAPLSLLDEIYAFQDIERNLRVADYSEIHTAFLAFMYAYEEMNDPFYLSESFQDEQYWELPARALHFAQQWVHAEVFEPETMHLVDGLSFEAHEVFPGSVGNTQARVASATVSVDCDYSTDPAAEYIWADTVLRPLGHYVAAGEQVDIEVDPVFVNQGLKIVVGSHVRDLDPEIKPSINRFRDISKAYDLNQERITVANPFGGGLYVCVPDGSALGAVDVTIAGAVKSPYFSGRAGNVTDVSAWLAEVAISDAPWADFETDKFMTTVPVSFLSGVTQPDQIMARWDAMMDQYRMSNGRPLEGRIRAEYYLLDRMLVTPAWGAGYPMVVPISSAEGASSNWNPMSVLTVAPNRTWFHELGHNCAIPGPVTNPESRVLADLSVKELGQWAEGENLVHIPGFSIYNQVYGYSVVDAFSMATTQALTIDQAAYDWMITENFRNNRQIGLDTSGVYDIDNNNATDEMRYQARGLGRYGDIVQLFGWEGLNLFHSEFYPIRLEDQATPDGKAHRIDRDAFIRRASEALQVNMAPLLHFWGVKPSAELKAELDVYPKSLIIKERLEHYLSIAPQTRVEFDSIITEISPAAGSYSVQRYDYYQTYVTDDDAQDVGSQVEFVLSEYGLDTDQVIFNLSLRHRPDGRVMMNWSNDDENAQGFVIRMKAPGDVIFTELGATDGATEFLTEALADGAYTFSVAALDVGGTESLPTELSVAQLPDSEHTEVQLQGTVFQEGAGFVGTGLSTEYFTGSSTGGETGGTFETKAGTRLRISATEILRFIQTDSGDDSIGYDDVTIDSVVLHLPAVFQSGPSLVRIHNTNTSSYDAYAGGSNTAGAIGSFELGEQSLDITALYRFGEGDDFDFFLYNRVFNSDISNDVSYLEIEYTVNAGYRHWTETSGLESGINAGDLDDPDFDGVVNFLEYAFGRDPMSSNEGAAVHVGSGVGADELEIRFVRGQYHLRYQIEMTTDLGNWDDAEVVWDSEVSFLDVVDVGDEQVVPVSTDGAGARFYRVRIIEDYDGEEIT